MEEHFVKIKNQLVRLQECIKKLRVIEEASKQEFEKTLRDIEEDIKDFQAEYSNQKSKLGFLNFNYHKLCSNFYAKVDNKRMSLREHSIYLQYSMFEEEDSLDVPNESVSINESSLDAEDQMEDENSSQSDEKSFDLVNHDSVEEPDGNYQNIVLSLKESGLNLHILQNEKFVENFFSSCSKYLMSSELKSIVTYDRINNLMFRLKHFLKEDLIELQKLHIIQDSIRDENSNIVDKIEKSIKLLENQIDGTFSKFQKAFVLSWLHLAEKDLTTVFYRVSENDNVETINKLYKKYALLFHPDKTCSENVEKVGELFIRLFKIKSRLISQCLSKKNDIEWFLKEGSNYYKIAKDYHFAYLKDFSRLEILDKKDLKITESESYKKFSMHYFELSCEKYREACYICDEKLDYTQMLELRIKISECFSGSENRFLEAQLAALGCIYLVNKKYPSQYTAEQKDRAESHFNNLKTKNKESAANVIKVSTSTVSNICNQTNHENVIEKDGARIFREILTVDKNLIKLHPDKSECEHDIFKVKLAQSASALGTTVSFLSSVYGVTKSFAVAFSGASVGLTGLGYMVPFILPVVGTVGGVVGLIASYNKYKEISNEGSLYRNELEIRKKMDELVQNSVKAFETNNIKEFFRYLSMPFYEYEKVKERLIVVNCECSQFEVEPKRVIKYMHQHGFRPEAIAYLLNLIFESLLIVFYDAALRKEFSQAGIRDSVIKAKMFDILDAICLEPIDTDEINLKKEAIKLDEKLREIQSRILIDNSFLQRKVKNKFYCLLGYIQTGGIIDDNLIKDSEERTFQSRFNEVVNIAKMNNIICVLVIEQNDILLKRYIDEIQKLQSEFNHVNRAYLRFETLKDFIWLFTGDIKLREKLQDYSSSNLNVDKQKNLNLIMENLNIEEQFKNLMKEAQLSENLAVKYREFPIKSSELWLDAKNKYEEAIEGYKSINSENLGNPELLIEIHLSYMKACYNLAKYTKLNEFIKSNKLNKFLNQRDEFWYIGSQMHTKLRNYTEADKFISHAIRISPNVKEFTQHSDLIKHLIITNSDRYITTATQRTIIRLESDYYAKMHDTNKIQYNILSIDGGGLRGIIPCVWLNEIERKLQRPISHFFNTIAGTSTGAIIGAALTVQQTATIPKFNASDVLKIYIEEGPNIFKKRSYLPSFANLFKAKYQNTKLENLMNSFSFKNYKLANSLSDLIVPALRLENTTRSVIFSSYEARRNENLNFSYYDILMSTTAAPTYFQNHKIENHGKFLDGGLQFNDPSHLAYAETVKNYGLKDQDIFVLSMGTSTFIPEFSDSFSDDAGLINVGRYVSNIMLDPNAGNVENTMYNTLGFNYSNYHRWQVLSENEVPMDDGSKETIESMTEMARQFIEEQYASDNNYFNKLLEKLERDCKHNELTFYADQPL